MSLAGTVSVKAYEVHIHFPVDVGPGARSFRVEARTTLSDVAN